AQVAERSMLSIDTDVTKYAQNNAQCKAGENFALHYLPPIAQTNLAQRHGLDDQCGGLGTTVPSARHNERDEDGKNDSARQLRLVMTHHRGGEELPQKKENQPSGSFLNQVYDRHVHIGFIERLGTPDTLHVFGIFFVCYPKDIIHGNNTEHNLLIVCHGQGYPVIHPENVNSFFLRIIGLQGYQPIVHQIANNYIGLNQEDFPDTDIIEQYAFVVNHIQNINGF